MPVMSAEQRIVGMLSVEDLLQFIIIDDDQMQYVGGKRVADAMSQRAITADPVSNVRRIAQAMLEYHLHSVPIVDEHDALIGIVSRSDIMRALMNDPPLTMWW
jgi:acetoin utilization protein AcuB